MKVRILIAATVLALAPIVAHSDSRHQYLRVDMPKIVPVQNHAGQLDTDGILSPGEVPNSRIDYDRSQRHHERVGDERVENEFNDRAASEDRYYKDRDHNLRDREEARIRYYQEREREERRERRQTAWWNW